MREVRINEVTVPQSEQTEIDFKKWIGPRDLWATTKDLTFVSLVSQRERRKNAGLKKYLKK